MPKIEMYITQGGRIVTRCGLPWSAIMMIRRSNGEGFVINKDQDTFPPLQAPAGGKRVRSRDSKGSASYPANTTELPLPDGRIRTKRGDKEFRTGFFNMLAYKCTGDPWEQHRQLQMLRGVYKSERCKFEIRGGKCFKGSDCCFLHSTDNDNNIDAVVMPFRRRIFMELYDEGFALPIEIRHEIGKMTTLDYQEAARKKEMYEERAEERLQRPRMHDDSRSPRSSPSDRDSTTPDPNRNKGNKGKGKGGGDALALMNIDEDNSERQRDHTSGDNIEDEDSDREEAVAPIDVNEGNIYLETPPEPAELEAMQTSPHNDGEDIEPTPQLERETMGKDMSTGLPEVDV